MTTPEDEKLVQLLIAQEHSLEGKQKERARPTWLTDELSQLTQGLEGVGWLGNHAYHEKRRRQIVESGNASAQDMKDIANEEKDYRALRNARIELLRVVPEPMDDRRAWMRQFEKNKEALKAMEWKEPTEAARLRQQEPNCIVAHDIFKDGLQAILCDPTKYSEHAVHEIIPGLEKPGIGFRLHPHQQEGLGLMEHYVRKYGCAVLADQMGVEKTLLVVAFIKRELLRAASEPGQRQARFLIIASQSLLQVWEDEFKRDPGIKVATIDSENPGQYEYELLSTFDVVVTTYDVVVNQWTELKKVQLSFQYAYDGLVSIREQVEVENKRRLAAMKSNECSLEPLCFEHPNEPLFAISWRAVILDEAHNIRNTTTRKNNAVTDLISDWRIALSGTPMMKGHEDLYALWLWMRFSPWVNWELFSECFIASSKERKRGPQERVDEDALLILTCVSGACTIRRPHRDEFEGYRISAVQAPEEVNHFLDLNPDAQETQSGANDIESVRRRGRELDRLDVAAFINKLDGNRGTVRRLFGYKEEGET